MGEAVKSYRGIVLKTAKNKIFGNVRDVFKRSLRFVLLCHRYIMLHSLRSKVWRVFSDHQLRKVCQKVENIAHWKNICGSVSDAAWHTRQELESANFARNRSISSEGYCVRFCTAWNICSLTSCVVWNGIM